MIVVKVKKIICCCSVFIAIFEQLFPEWAADANKRLFTGLLFYLLL